jgi:hypothetical protein
MDKTEIKENETCPVKPAESESCRDKKTTQNCNSLHAPHEADNSRLGEVGFLAGHVSFSFISVLSIILCFK